MLCLFTYVLVYGIQVVLSSQFQGDNSINTYLTPASKSYCVLYAHSSATSFDGRLALYPSEEDYKRNPSRYKGIPMQFLAGVAEGGLDKSKGFTLDVTGDTKIYFLLAETKKECHTWLALLRSQTATTGDRLSTACGPEATKPEVSDVMWLRSEEGVQNYRNKLIILADLIPNVFISPIYQLVI